jgi:hypothetical protein
VGMSAEHPAATAGFFMRLPRNRREACWWWLRLRFQWPFWRQTRLIEPVWSWWVNRGR